MRVQDLQQFLSSFTEGSDAVKNAVLLCEVNGTLYDVRRMEVHENEAPIPGFKGHTAHRLVLLGPRSPKLVHMFRGSRITELAACGLKLEPLCLGLDACCLELSKLGA